MARAFHRISDLMRWSIVSSRGLSRSSFSGGIVLRYGVVAGLRDHLVQQEERTVRTLVGQNRIEGLSPFTGLGRVKIFQHQRPLITSPGDGQIAAAME
jgi:hypothetical protein